MDHPRIRGEYPLLVKIISLEMGSPPHTRGIPMIEAEYNSDFRITPAYAGNTL